MNWIHVAEVKAQWRAILKMVMNLQFTYKEVQFLTS